MRLILILIFIILCFSCKSQYVSNNSNGDFSSLVAAYKTHNNLGFAQHVYMADLIENMTANIGNFVFNEYGYPSPSSGGDVLSHYMSVAWSGIALLSDPSGVAPYIENPLFVLIHPDINDRIDIVNTFNKENDTSLSNGKTPLLNNKCN